MTEAATGRCSVENLVGLHTVNIVDLFQAKRLFLQETAIFKVRTEIRTGSIFQEFRSSGARNKFATGALFKILNYLKDHPDFPGYCKYMFLSSRRLKKYVFIFSASKQIPQRNSSVFQ